MRPPTAGGPSRITAALRDRRSPGPPLVAFLTAGYPERASFAHDLLAVAREADLVEIGVPFSDPMADGVTIQRASRRALEQGVSLAWILETLEQLDEEPGAPLLLMSYLNPLLNHGYDRLARDAARCGIAGFIVPDLPFEECAPLRQPLHAEGVGLVQLVTPVTAAERAARLCAESDGFVYAVTVAGITGGAVAEQGITDYLDRLRAVSPCPVCAGFGIRNPDQVCTLAPHTDGLVVGSALVEILERREDPGAFLRWLRGVE